MQPFPPLKDFTYLVVPLALRLVRPVSIWFFILQCFSILTYRSGLFYQNYCTLAGFHFVASVLLYIDASLTLKLLQKHVHYRLWQTIIDEIQDIELWICVLEIAVVIVFQMLGYNRYREFKSASKYDKTSGDLFN